MKPHTQRGFTDYLRLLFAAGLMTLAQAVLAGGDIDTNNNFAWAENAGWVNFASTNSGVTVSRTGLSGCAWAENIGWVQLGNGKLPYGNSGATDWGVNATKGAGPVWTLSGFAWSENCGWINFSPSNSVVTIDGATGRFNGYAWSENLGWIHLRNASPAYGVITTARLIPTGTAFMFR